MKKALKVITEFFCTLLAIVIIVAALNLRYLPTYNKNAAQYDASQVSYGESINIVSANVRTWSPTDILQKSWFFRADKLLKSVTAQSPDIIGFQEVTKMHYAYLTENLTGYDNVLEYRDNSPLSEGCPIFYRSDRFELVDKGSFWLSETPEVMSKDWNSACYRICSYVILKDIQSQSELVVFNTHLDHISDEARINGIKVVLDKIAQFGGLPSIIMGDFNADETSETYKCATENFLDAKYQTDRTMTGATYQGFGKALDRENIDYFMISKEGIKVNEYRIIDTLYDGKYYPSDHFPIYLNIELDK